LYDCALGNCMLLMQISLNSTSWLSLGHLN
jgi:hypothetical protein